jgi:hypothetical protein
MRAREPVFWEAVFALRPKAGMFQFACHTLLKFNFLL